MTRGVGTKGPPADRAPETTASTADAVDLLVGSARLYFDALYFGDVDRFRQVMHPLARLFSPTHEDVRALDLDQYCSLVAGRPSPYSRQDPRYDAILSLSVASPMTAHMRVRDAYLPRIFTDDLTFIRTAAGWQIAAKVWYYEELAGLSSAPSSVDSGPSGVLGEAAYRSPLADHLVRRQERL